VKVRWKIFHKPGSKQLGFDNEAMAAEPKKMIKFRPLMDSFEATLEQVAKNLD
jgi:hypothetical protein